MIERHERLARDDLCHDIELPETLCPLLRRRRAVDYGDQAQDRSITARRQFLENDDRLRARVAQTHRIVVEARGRKPRGCGQYKYHRANERVLWGKPDRSTTASTTSANSRLRGSGPISHRQERRQNRDTRNEAYEHAGARDQAELGNAFERRGYERIEAGSSRYGADDQRGTDSAHRTH